ncbi:MAG: glycosyltransferase family 2 protein [Oscillospiraceae bacterium]|nr:glycosyltransferase family 2 protein [Oscillospiraceae bacterium]
MVKISVSIPVYNAEKYISECIESIINQSFNDWELILVDDGSTDLSGKICKQYALNDSRIRYIYQNNTGQSSARNRGIDESKGEYIMFMDADDCLYPNALSICYNKMQNNSVDIVCAECKSISEDGTEFGYERPKFPERLLNNLEYAKMILCHKTLCSIWGKLYKSSFIGKNRFMLNADRGGDILFWSMTLPNKYCNILLCDIPIYKYRILKQSASHGKIAAQIQKLNRFNDNLLYTKSLLPNEYSNIAVYYDVAILYNIDEIINKQGFYKTLDKRNIELIRQFYPNVRKTTDERFSKSWILIEKLTNNTSINIVLSIGYFKRTLIKKIKEIYHATAN